MSILVSETVYFPQKSYKSSITMCVFHIYFRAKIMLQSVAKKLYRCLRKIFISPLKINIFKNIDFQKRYDAFSETLY